jgi:predicted N-acetyltransferase YhbS
MQLRVEAQARLRPMTEADLPAAHALSREARWPHRIEDWEIMLRCGQGLVAEQDGQIVGTVMGFPHGDEVATLGMVIVSSNQRGAGLGRRLMDAMIEALAPRAIQLNATQDGMALYKSQGFVPIGSIHQHQGAAFSTPLPKLRRNERVRPLGASDAARITELDHAASGLRRDRLFQEMVKQANGVMLDRDGVAVGFALFRRFGLGYVIGPLVAPDREGARTLIGHWVGANPGMFIRLDIPGESGAAPQPQPGVATFAIASQALG